VERKATAARRILDRVAQLAARPRRKRRDIARRYKDLLYGR